MNNQELEVIESGETMTFDDAQRQFSTLKSFIKSQMLEGVDFGTIPGTPKPSLWKPGAEKLLYFHNLGVRLEPTGNTKLDWTGDFFNYEYKAIVYSKKSGMTISEAFGSCNSLESKYQSTIKRTGARAANLANTMSKIAQKRAIVSAALMATRASFYFTQDMEEDNDTLATPAAKQTEGTSSEETISEAQIKLIYALAKQSKFEGNELRQSLKDNLPYCIGEDGNAHLSKILKKDIHGLVEFLNDRIRKQSGNGSN